ncbi:hypothetical protein ACHHYP_14586 [Achlya hypogyna]|uniref:Uncharacterized protein n=1 Tax=Achlya hypogyna TaxID=1202772 RepID=A0A1V9YCW3_ACHHY|nr:hypothetical protein ACHHYP_14586 [Achlya hypogyna]
MWPSFALSDQETVYRRGRCSDIDIDAALEREEEKLQLCMDALVQRKAPTPWGVACKPATEARYRPAMPTAMSPTQEVHNDVNEPEEDEEELALDLEDVDEEDEDMEMEDDEVQATPAPDRQLFVADDEGHDTFDASFESVGTVQRTIQFFASPIEAYRLPTPTRRTTPRGPTPASPFSLASPVVFPHTIPEPMSAGSHMSLHLDSDGDLMETSIEWDPSSLR